MDDELRSKLIRLAYANPELRGDLLPLLIREAKQSQPVQEKQKDKKVTTKADPARNPFGKTKHQQTGAGYHKTQKSVEKGSDKPKHKPDWGKDD